MNDLARNFGIGALIGFTIFATVLILAVIGYNIYERNHRR